MAHKTKQIFEVDATDQSLGRVASKIAMILRGKNLASYQPHITPQTEVVVTNLKKVKFTGQKLDQKTYYHYSGYPGGMKERNLGDLWAAKPQEVLRKAVLRMLPANRTRSVIIKNLKFK